MANFKQAMRKVGKFLKKNGYIFLIIICIAAIGTMIYLAVDNSNNPPIDNNTNNNQNNNDNNNNNNNNNDDDDDDDDIPLGPPVIIIGDDGEQIPLSPGTGDATNLYIWAGGFIVLAGALSVLIAKRRKES